jgi:hypothetical protein
MSSQLDPSEFVDEDFQAARKGPSMAASPFGSGLGEGGRAPTREEVDSRVTEMQQKLTELKQAQQELERERTALEELRRRQMEFTTGRQEMTQHLTRGVGLLEEAEFAARRDAEQMAKALLEFKNALAKIQDIHEETWSKDGLNVELTRALTVIENARMEWNAARLKFEVLSTKASGEGASPAADEHPLAQALESKSYAEICKLGLALTWPIALAALGIFLALILR